MKIDLETDIQLCSPEVEDAEDLFRVVDTNRDYLSPWLPWVPFNRSSSDSRAFLADAVEKRGRGELCSFLIREQGAIRGVVGLNSIDAANRCAEVGYWLSEDAAGRGLMSRSVHALILHSFEAHGVNRLQLRAAVDNARSRALAERAGFSEEGVLREAEQHSDGYVDLVMYSLLRREFVHS